MEKIKAIIIAYYYDNRIVKSNILIIELLLEIESYKSDIRSTE